MPAMGIISDGYFRAIWSKTQMVTPEEKKQIAKDAVSLIVSDIEDRRGIGDEWGSIDHGTQMEIRKEWRGIIVASITKAFKKGDGKP